MTDRTCQGVVLHAPEHLRVRGRLPDGRWVAARCTPHGKDLEPAELVRLPADQPFLARVVRSMDAARAAARGTA